MKRKITAAILALTLFMTLVPMTVMAVSIPPKSVAPVIELLEERKFNDGSPYLYCEFSIPQIVMDIVNEEGDVNVGFDVAVKVDNGQWFGGEALAYYFSPSEVLEGTQNRYFVNINQENDATNGAIDIKAHIYSVKLHFLYNDNGSFSYSDYGLEKSIGAKGFTASSWASDELRKADELGLIPDVLKKADLTKNITRAEFAAVAVKVYENLSGTKAIPAPVNPFKDTTDSEVLKAYNTGLMVGVSASKFEPDTILNREQAATALTRVLKRATIPDWTFATDGNYTLNFTQPQKFADDKDISDWAKQSVYFMVANDIIKGMGGNKFAPRAVTTAEQAQGYAAATREQALLIAARMVENLSGKDTDYTSKP